MPTECSAELFESASVGRREVMGQAIPNGALVEVDPTGVRPFIRII
jgi:hypothetical protein